jgi:hypothetical protein
MSATAVELRRLLKNCSHDDKNLYDHLTDVFLKILHEKPKDAYRQFENISSNLKNYPNIPPNSTITNIKSTDQTKLQEEWYLNSSQKVI